MSDKASWPATMRGWAIGAYGQEMVLKDDLPVPTPGPHDILMHMCRAEVGDWVEFGISHPCTVFDKWPMIPVLDERDRVVDLIRTFF